jgi:rsbT co-antagonist protein RsbR
LNNEGESLLLLQQENAALRERVARLEKTASRFESLCSILDGVVLVLDENGRYVEAFGTRILPPSVADNLVNGNVRDTFPKSVADEIVATVRRTLDTGERGTLEYAIPGQDAEVWHRAELKLLDGRIVLWFAQDVSTERRLRSSERERIELQERMIEAQRAALRELSTPLVPLADGVIAMPLVGAIDSDRAQEVMEKLLDGIVKQRARAAILDITGVQMVDSRAADALLRVARAARLLGAQLILTGIGPDIAQALVHLEADMTGVVTRANLQSGIAYALRGAAGR